LYADLRISKGKLHNYRQSKKKMGWLPAISRFCFSF
jgi:hypothetical protein